MAFPTPFFKLDFHSSVILWRVEGYHPVVELATGMVLEGKSAKTRAMFDFFQHTMSHYLSKSQYGYRLVKTYGIIDKT